MDASIFFLDDYEDCGAKHVVTLCGEVFSCNLWPLCERTLRSSQTSFWKKTNQEWTVQLSVIYLQTNNTYALQRKYFSK